MTSSCRPEVWMRSEPLSALALRRPSSHPEEKERAGQDDLKFPFGEFFNLLYKRRPCVSWLGVQLVLIAVVRQKWLYTFLLLSLLFSLPLCLPCTDWAVLPPEQRHVAFNTTAFCSQFTPPCSFGKSCLSALVAEHIILDSTSIF